MDGAPAPPNKSTTQEIDVTPSSNFDLDSYAHNYVSHTKVDRLLFISSRSKKLRTQALQAAITELKKGQNTIMYRKLFEKIGDELGGNFSFDAPWADSIDKRAAQTLERLEMELNGSKTNLIKENIRAGHQELGDFFFARGDLNAALRSYLRLRDYCSTSQHVIDMCMSVITVSIHMQNFAHVMNYVSKAEQTPDLTDKTAQDKLKVCAALAHFDSRKYKQAAKKFLEVQFSTIAGKFPEVISAQDITVYTTLAALAEFERSEIKARVIDNSDFRNFLEQVPDMRDIVYDFYNSKYGSCLTALEKIRGDLLLDLHLHDHVNSLYTKIRNKAVVQYFSPFVSVDLNNMAQAFATDIASLEKELAALIVDGTIQARIDSHNKRLYARQSDERNTTFHKALHVGEQFQRDSKAILLRVNLIRNDFVVKPARSSEREGGRDRDHHHRDRGTGAGASSAGDKPDRKMQ